MILIIALFAWAIWCLVGAVWTIASLIPLLILLPIAGAIDVFMYVANTRKRRAAEGRRRAFKERVEKALRRHDETFPEAQDHDEDGIPYLILPLVILPSLSILTEAFGSQIFG